MHRRFRFLVVLLLIGAAAGTVARGETVSVIDALSPGGAATVTEVVDGDTVVLDDGRQVRLVGIQAPKLPLGRKGFVAWPLADRAKTALEALSLGRQVSLGYGGRRTDRHGRALAHLFLPDGRWVQGELLSQGMARVYSFPDNRAVVPQMLRLERAARAARAGIWGDDWYAVRTPEATRRDLGTFQLVEGLVVAVAEVRGRYYLNFGADWRTDFTVMVAKGRHRLFEEMDFDLKALEGRSVRVRGWIDQRNGPMIEATHPEQIELLEGQDAAAD